MGKRNFEEWLSEFKPGIAGWNYYVDFEKVYDNAAKYRVECHILNSLIGSEEPEKDFRKLLTDYPKVINVVPLLLAVRKDTILIHLTGQDKEFDFKKYDKCSIDDYCMFMEKTGLFNLLSKKIINNVYDYITGVEVGLDSNGRKNRTGHLMEDIVEQYIINEGFIKDKTYFKEMTTSTIKTELGYDLSAITFNGLTKKRFDFVIKTDECLFGLEVNFYTGNGSKLNETARSYKQLAEEAEQIDNFKFVWITDGPGWKGAKRNLNETFSVLDNLYNINDLDNGIIKEITGK